MPPVEAESKSGSGRSASCRRLLLITCGRWSNSAQRLGQALAQTDEPVEVEAQDIEPALLTGWRARLRAMPHALLGGGWSMFRRGGAFKDAVKRTPWYVRRVGRAVADAARQTRFDLALIIGTLVPGFVLDCPYFIYTDMPILGNAEFPGGQERVDYWKHCLPLERWNLHAATGVFTMSQFARRVLCERYSLPGSRILAVNAGCNSTIRACPVDRNGSLDVLFVGLDWQRKGGPELLEAFRRVRQRLPRATLTIVGCSPSLDEPGVRVVGRVPSEQLSQYYQRAAVFAMPSRREPFGIVYLEAMQAALPAIATARGAAPEMVRDGWTGYCVPPGDVAALADRLEQLLRDPAERRKLGEQGRAVVQAEYTWQRTASRIVRFMLSGQA